MNPYMKQYRNNQIATAPREQILLMLYDGAIRFVAQARAAIESGDRIGKLEPISRAMAIVSELSNTLDHNVGGEIAENLDALYHYMIRNLSQANLRMDAEPLKPVESILRDLRATWAEAVEISRRPSSAGEDGSLTVSGGNPAEMEEPKRICASF